MEQFPVHIEIKSPEPKYRQIINQIHDGISAGWLQPGDPLPSVNQLIEGLGVSRDTVFKAYETLKGQGAIVSRPGKGYFIRTANKRVLLFLDQYSPFKASLYNAMRKNLPADFAVDLYFHHYNFEVFRNVLYSSSDRYNYIVLMSLAHDDTALILNKLDPEKLLILDVRHGAPVTLPVIYQDFNESFYYCLKEASLRFKKYIEVCFILPPETHHPQESSEAFLNFCQDFDIRGAVFRKLTEDQITEGRAFIVVSDDDLVMIMEVAGRKGYLPGKTIGIVSYNDTPVKKVIGEGITVISTDFHEMGQKAVEYLLTRNFRHLHIPTKLILRKSL